MRRVHELGRALLVEERQRDVEGDGEAVSALGVGADADLRGDRGAGQVVAGAAPHEHLLSNTELKASITQ